MTTLLVAAERREVAEFVKRCPGAERLDWGLDYAVRCNVRGESWLVVANGAGPRLARQAVETAVSRSPDVAVVSTGFCGAVDPALSVGDILVVSRVRSLAGLRPALRPQRDRTFHVGELFSSDRVIGAVSERERLAGEGVRAVEMEAGAIAAFAAERNLPFFCVRVVSDGAGEEFPLDLNQYRDPSGRFQTGRIASAGLLRPVSVLPGLLRLSRQSRRAAKALGEFLIECTFTPEHDASRSL